MAASSSVKQAVRILKHMDLQAPEWHEVQEASREATRRVIRVMTTLNKAGAEAMAKVGANACTDVTGFGLLGHLHEMCAASGVGARINLSKVPVLVEAWELVREDVVPGGTKANLAFLAEAVDFAEEITEDQQLVLADAQTSGGLLISVAEAKAEDLTAELKEAGALAAADVGEMVVGEPGRIEVVR